MPFEVVLTDAPDPSARDVIASSLAAFNEARGGPSNFRRIAVLIRDPNSGEILGGLWGVTAFGWLLIELLFVPVELRGVGLGADLMQRAEKEAARRGCTGAWLDTFSFQVRGFYERLGYSTFGSSTSIHRAIASSSCGSVSRSP